jgi:hypothetical protein
MVRPDYKPTDTFIGINFPMKEASILDFWQWAFGDLCDDDIKGIFVEWMVAKLLGIQTARRISWANSDLKTINGVRIEIKSSSYWQSWKLLDGEGNLYNPPLYPITEKTHITFAGLKARDATLVSKDSDQPDLKSDVYIFAFQHETDP